jgi:glycosyltransferase involved in cell wall biosynthesis
VAVVLLQNQAYGGGFQYALSIIAGLAALPASRYRVSAITLHDGWRPHIPEPIEVHRSSEPGAVRMVRRALYALPGGVRAWRSISETVHPVYRLLERLDPQLTFYPSQAAFVFGSRRRGVAPIHDLMHRYEARFSEVGNRFEQARRDFLYSNICRYAAAVLVDSRVGCEHVASAYGVDPARIRVLPFVAPPYVEAAPRMGPVPELRRDLPEHFIFYPANLWPHKNHLGLLRARAALRDAGLKVNAVFCGRAEPGSEAIFEAVARMNLNSQVTYLDYIENNETVAIYRRATALVMPTFFGPTNIPPLEAFALGCPVCVSDVYGMREQVGDAALLFDPSSDLEIADVVARVWTDEALRQSLVRKGIDRARAWNQAAFNIRVRVIVDGLLAC